MEPRELYAGVRFSFLIADHYRFASSWVYPASIAPYFLFRFVTKGTADFSLDSASVAVSRGDVVYVPEGTKLSRRATGEEFAFISVRFVSSIELGHSDFLAAYYGAPAATSSGTRTTSGMTSNPFLTLLKGVRQVGRFRRVACSI